MALNAIFTQQDSVTESTNESIDQPLDYLVTYSDEGIFYRSRNVVFAAQSDSGFHNKSKGCSRNGSHIFLAEDEPFPLWDGTILTIAQIIKFVTSSATEAELGALFITAKEIVPMRHTLIEMGWPRPPLLIQTDNSTEVGVVDDTTIARKIKSMGTGPLDPTIETTTALSTTRHFTKNKIVPYLRASLSGCTNIF